MPSIDDLFDELTTANAKLQTIHNDLQSIDGKVQPLHNDLQSIDTKLQTIHNDLQSIDGGIKSINNGINDLKDLHQYTNYALYHLSLQNDSSLCILEKISKAVCLILNEEHQQTKLQTSTDANVAELLDLYRFEHANAVVEIESRKQLNKKIEKCCPPPKDVPICNYTQCDKPSKLPKPRDKRKKD